MKNKGLAIIYLAIFFMSVVFFGTCFNTVSQAQEEINTKIIIEELSFTQKDGSCLKGNFKITNKENIELKKLVYAIEVFAGEEAKDLRNIKIEKPEELNLSALETKTIEFNVVFPINIPTDYYQMHINVFAPAGKLANKVEPIGKLTGNTKVTFDNSGVILIIDGKEYYPKTDKIEPLAIGTDLKGYINITNISQSLIKVYPEIKLYLLSDYINKNEPLKVLKGTSSELKPAESKKFGLNFEKQTVAGSLIIAITIKNDNGGEESETLISGYNVKPDASQQTIYKNMPKDVVGTQYEGAVGYLIDGGIIGGYTDGTFKPNNNITRAEFAKICTLLFKNSLKDISQSTTLKKFKDVNSKHWASKYIDVCSGNQLIKGYQDNTFKPEANVTYGEALTILVRGMGYGEEVEKSSKQWPENYYQKAMDLNVICLCISDKVKANLNKPATRGDIAIIAASVRNYISKSANTSKTQ